MVTYKMIQISIYKHQKNIDNTIKIDYQTNMIEIIIKMIEDIT